MFGSRLLSSLSQAGHETEIVAGEPALRERISAVPEGQGAVLVADLTDDRLDGAAILESLRAADLLGSLRTVAFFSHVESAVRERARKAGFEVIVPRSRMAREAPSVIEGLASS